MYGGKAAYVQFLSLEVTKHRGNSANRQLRYSLAATILDHAAASNLIFL